MALDDKAMIEIGVQVQGAIADIQKFRAEWELALQQIRAANAAGLEPGSVEFERIRARAVRAGDAFVAAGERGRAAMLGVAEATGQAVPELEAVNAQLTITKVKVDGLRADSQAGAAGMNFLGDAAEKTSKKLLGFGAGIVAGVLISELQPALEGAAKGFGDFLGRIQAESDAVPRLNSASRSLAETRKVLEDHTRKLEDAERKLHEAYLAQFDSVRMEIEHGKLIAAEIQKDLDLRAQIREQLVGNAAAREQHTAALLAEIEATKKNGEVNKQTTEAIQEAITEELKLYDERGAKIPPELAAEAQAWNVLSAAQKQAKADSDAYYQSFLDNLTKQKQAQSDELRKQAAQDGAGKDPTALKQQIADLEAQTTLSLEQTEKLSDLKTQLARSAQQATQQTVAEANALQDSYVPAAAKAANQMAELGNQFALAHGEIDQFGNKIADSAVSFDDLNKNVSDLADGTRDLGDQQTDFAKSIGDSTKAVDDLGKAAKGSGKELSEAMKDSASSTKEIEETLDRIKDSKMPGLIDLAKQLRDILNDSGGGDNG